MLEKVSPDAKGDPKATIEARKNILRYLTASTVDGAVNLQSANLEQGSKFDGVQLGLHISVLRLLASSMLGPLAFLTVGGKTSDIQTSVSHERSAFADIQGQIVGMDGGSKQSLGDYLVVSGLTRHRDGKGFDLQFDDKKIKLPEFTTTFSPNTAVVLVTPSTNAISVEGSPKFRINLEKKTIEITVTQAKSVAVTGKPTTSSEFIGGDKEHFAAELTGPLSLVRNNIIMHYNRSGLRTNENHLKALDGMAKLSINDAWNIFLKVPGVNKIIGKSVFIDDQKVALLQEIKNETAGYILSRNFPIATMDKAKDAAAIKQFVANSAEQIKGLPREYQADIRKGNYGALMLALEAKKYSIDGGKTSINAQESAAKLL